MGSKTSALILLFASILLMNFDGCGDSSSEGPADDAPAEEKAASTPKKAEYKICKWVWEPREKAFKVLIPDGWTVDGGIFRVDPSAAGGVGNAIEAKLDFSIKADAAGTTMMRWYPEINYIDASKTPAGQMGMFPTGSNYNGMTVMPLMSAANFLEKVALPFARPKAKGIRVTKRKQLPSLAKAVKGEVKLLFDMGFKYDAALLSVEYNEGGTLYEENFITAIMDLGPLMAGMWKNRFTISARAPKGKLKDAEPVFADIGKSLVMNTDWLVGEIKGQAKRGEIALKTQQEIIRIGREITEHRQKTNEIIQNDMYLTLTGQEEYKNPYTGEIEVGAGLHETRWVREDGDVVIYSDDINFNPNEVEELNHYGFKKSPVHLREVK